MAKNRSYTVKVKRKRNKKTDYNFRQTKAADKKITEEYFNSGCKKRRFKG